MFKKGCAVLSINTNLSPRSVSWNMNTFDHLFLRHADRPSFKPNSWGHNVSITLKGKQASQSMGKKLRSNNLSYYLWSSPIKRCLETAEAICKGLESTRDVRKSPLLGGPGFFIQNSEKASIIFKEYPLPELIDLYLHEKVFQVLFLWKRGVKRCS